MQAGVSADLGHAADDYLALQSNSSTMFTWFRFLTGVALQPSLPPAALKPL